jgi:hypothetical protein
MEKIWENVIFYRKQKLANIAKLEMRVCDCDVASIFSV